MAMTIAIGALAEDAQIFFFAPLIVPVVMGGGEFGFSSK
jgi:hypothetical protein